MPANPKIRLETSHGNIVIELDAAKAPVTCENFITYVKDAFYDTTIFHRVIPGFMIQGGGFTSDMMQKPARPNIKNEADNGLGNKRGTIAMARTPDPHSASGQFFINIKENPVQVNLFDWIEVHNFKLSFGFLLDQLSILWLLFVTGIGSLIHLYSISIHIFSIIFCGNGLVSRDTVRAFPLTFV